MKPVRLFVLSLALMGLLAACGGEEADPQSAAEPAPVAEAAPAAAAPAAAPQTADVTALAVAAAVMALGSAVIVSKKRK